MLDNAVALLPLLLLPRTLLACARSRTDPWARGNTDVPVVHGARVVIKPSQSLCVDRGETSPPVRNVGTDPGITTYDMLPDDARAARFGRGWRRAEDRLACRGFGMPAPPACRRRRLRPLGLRSQILLRWR
jgi:hypothetical protein